jgi:hypothetical protein
MHGLRAIMALSNYGNLPRRLQGFADATHLIVSQAICGRHYSWWILFASLDAFT